MDVGPPSGARMGMICVWTSASVVVADASIASVIPDHLIPRNSKSMFRLFVLKELPSHVVNDWLRGLDEFVVYDYSRLVVNHTHSGKFFAVLC